MIGLYLAGFATGGVLLLFSVIGGGDDPDVDVDVDGDVDMDADAHGDGDDHAVSGGVTSTLAAVALTAFPFASLRFWTFFLAFGGLAGALLTALSPLGAFATALVAAALGYAAGVGSSALMRLVARDEVSSSLGARECVGTSATVVLPIEGGSRGRVRVHVDGRTVDFDAESDDELALAVAAPVFVYAIRDDGVALVASLPSKLDPSP
ncbi:MAG: hypothetical protein KIT84_15905 [Labilithrix sp.]|nr:hypothetical protein [Labilithrix sp.]MCW5812512.1 hypothetical protein [Labilithrix sp.]